MQNKIINPIFQTSTDINFEEEIFEHAMQKFLSSECLLKYNDFEIENNPYKRPSRTYDYKQGMFDIPAKLEDFNSNTFLFANRLLNTIYEQDLVFLPKGRLETKGFNAFYDNEFYKNGQIIKNKLENYTFGFLEKNISVSGNWTPESFVSYTQDILNKINDSASLLYKTINESKDKQASAKFYLVSVAGDFLSEASAMARNCLGNFGKPLSELFKVLIDEYGYGVYNKKHSSLFEDLLERLNMKPYVHSYFQFYTSSALMMTNYFHFISKNHKYIFKYFGALYFTEAVLSLISKHQSSAMKCAFGEDFDTLYFDEHDHIDKHHGRMALEEIILPLIKEYGNEIIPDILKGFEEFKLLGDIADEDFAKHIKWHDSITLADFKDCNYDISKAKYFNEIKGEISTPHVHEQDEVFFVEQGSLEFACSPFKKFELKEGDSIIIPKGCLHGTVILSQTCKYGSITINDGL